MRDQGQCADFPIVKMYTKWSWLTKRWDLGLSKRWKKCSSGDPVWYFRMMREKEMKDQKKKKTVYKNIKNEIEAMDCFRLF